MFHPTPTSMQAYQMSSNMSVLLNARLCCVHAPVYTRARQQLRACRRWMHVMWPCSGVLAPLLVALNAGYSTRQGWEDGRRFSLLQRARTVYNTDLYITQTRVFYMPEERFYSSIYPGMVCPHGDNNTVYVRLPANRRCYRTDQRLASKCSDFHNLFTWI